MKPTDPEEPDHEAPAIEEETAPPEGGAEPEAAAGEPSAQPAPESGTGSESIGEAEEQTWIYEEEDEDESPAAAARAFLALLAAALFTAWLSVRFSADSLAGWYPYLRRPDWMPPVWVFASLWAALSLMTTAAAWLVWRRAGWTGGGEALSLWFLQLSLQTVWYGLFFGLQSPALAAVEIPLLWLSAAITGREFGKIHPGAGILVAPYLLWVSFTALLNYLIWWMNTAG